MLLLLDGQDWAQIGTNSIRPVGELRKMDASREEQKARLYYRAKEVSELTGICIRTIRDQIARGKIPTRKIGVARLIPASWVEAATETEAELVRLGYIEPARVNIPKNPYSLGNGPCAHAGPLRLARLRTPVQLASAAILFFTLKTCAIMAA